MKDNIKNYNKTYNENVSIFIQQILSPERVGNAGYIPIGEYKKAETFFSPNHNIIVDEIPNDLFISNDLSEGERIVLSNLLFGEKTTYVLAGAMGSGKTALMNYIYSQAKAKYLDFIHAIYLNFNKGFSSDSPIEQTINLYKTSLSKQLIVLLRNLMDQYSLIDPYVLLIKNQREVYYFNNEFVELTKKQSWITLLENQKIDFLFNFIKSNNVQVDNLLYALFEILEAINALLIEKSVNIVLFFDNIDRLDPLSQIKILDDILSKNEISKVKTLIAMRRSSYKRFVRNASFDYGYFHHYGPYPIRVLKNRLEYWKDHLPEAKFFKTLDQRFKNALLERINYILFDIKKVNSYTQKFLHCLSGRSVRVGLDLAQRIFINNVFPFDQESDYDSNIARGLLIGANDSLIPEDQLILNIFQLPEYHCFSILQLRILQLLMEFKSKKHLMKFRFIIKILNKIGYKDDEEIKNCFNNLLDVQRPLIWLDTIGKLESIETMYLCDESINISEIGYNYFKYLIIDINYVQVCLSSIDWENFDKSETYEINIYKRFDYLRKCLNEIHQIDSQQIKSYINYNKKYQIESEIKNIELFSNRIIYNIFNRFIYITKDHKITFDKVQFYLDWKSLLTLCYNNSMSTKCRSRIDILLNLIEIRCQN